MKLIKYPNIQIKKLSENLLENSRTDLRLMKDKTTVHTHTYTHTHTFCLDNFLLLSLYFVTFI